MTMKRDSEVGFSLRLQNRERGLGRWVGIRRVWKLLGSRGIGTLGRRIVFGGQCNLRLSLSVVRFLVL